MLHILLLSAVKFGSRRWEKRSRCLQGSGPVQVMASHDQLCSADPVTCLEVGFWFKEVLLSRSNVSDSRGPNSTLEVLLLDGEPAPHSNPGGGTACLRLRPHLRIPDLQQGVLGQSFRRTLSRTSAGFYKTFSIWVTIKLELIPRRLQKGFMGSDRGQAVDSSTPLSQTPLSIPTSAFRSRTGLPANTPQLISAAVATAMAEPSHHGATAHPSSDWLWASPAAPPPGRSERDLPQRL